MSIIPYGKHYIDNEDIEQVIKVLKSNNLTQGPIIELFEKNIAEYVGSKYAIDGPRTDLACRNGR